MSKVLFIIIASLPERALTMFGERLNKVEGAL